MCCRYYIEPELCSSIQYKNLDELERRYSCAVRSGDFSPGDFAPVYAAGRDGEMTPYPMKWGFSAGKSLVFNARIETADQKPLFAPSFARRRCAIPASGYYEWKKTGAGKEKYVFTRKDGKDVLFAGLYRYEKGLLLPVFTLLTREAAPGIAGIHDRMPLILDAERAGEWLTGGTADAVTELDARATG